MFVEYALNMPFWSRVKLLLGWSLYVRVNVDPPNLNVTTFVSGEEGNLRPIAIVRTQS